MNTTMMMTMKNDIEEALIVEMPEGYLNSEPVDSEIDLFEDEKLI